MYIFYFLVVVYFITVLKPTNGQVTLPWKEITPTGTKPSARHGHTAVYYNNSMYCNFINDFRIEENMNTQLKDLQMQIDKELKQKKMLNKFNRDFTKLVLDKGKTYKGYAEYYKTLAILWIVIASQMAVIILFLTDIL